MDARETLNRVDRLIAARSILNHPFYQAWNAGELSADQLRSYARSYYPHVAAFPDYLRAAIAGTEDDSIRLELEDNLAEELSEPKAHDELWLDFGEALGLSRDEVRAAAPRPTTDRTVAEFRDLTQGSTAAAVAALYAYESQQPEVSRTKSDGLCEHYGVDTHDGLGYFEVHAEADVRHRAGERQALGRCLEQGATEEETLAATERALDAYWGLLDGVCRECGVALG